MQMAKLKGLSSEQRSELIKAWYEELQYQLPQH